MKCQNCDSELTPGARFCDACGAPVLPADAAVAGGPSYSYEPTPPAVTPMPPYTPPATTFSSASYTGGGFATEAEDKILGMPASRMGMISLILGGAGLLLSCVGCGGLLALLGLAAGFFSLKTSSRQSGVIGMILSGLALIVAMVMICLLVFAVLSSSQGGSYDYWY